MEKGIFIPHFLEETFPFLETFLPENENWKKTLPFLEMFPKMDTFLK